MPGRVKESPHIIDKTLFFFTAAAVLITVVLMFHSYIGLFSRMMSDEYAIFNLYRAKGFIGSFSQSFNHFNGRFSLLIVYNLFSITGPVVIPFLTFAALAVWIVGLSWSISRYLAVLDYRVNRLLSFLLSVIIIYATLNIAPNIFQSLYWPPGMFTYIFPLISMSLHVGLLAYFLKHKVNRRGGEILRLFFVFIFGFFSAGFSETQALVVLGAFLAALAVDYTWKKNTNPGYRDLLWASFSGTLLALIVQITAPGTHYRQSLFTSDLNLLSVFFNSIRYMFDFLSDILSRFTLTVLGVFSASFLFFSKVKSSGENSPRASGWKIFFYAAAGVVIGLMLIAGSMAPSFYVTSKPPLERVLVIPIFVFVLLIIYIGGLMGTACRPLFVPDRGGSRHMILFSMVFFIIVGGSVSRSIINLAYVSVQVKKYAYDWDYREKIIAAALQKGEKNINVFPLRNCRMMIGLDELSVDPGFWVNRVMAEYYGLGTIKLKLSKRMVLNKELQKKKKKRRHRRKKSE
jgi:hypothetical protein